mgnify:CR=1 FL=1
MEITSFAPVYIPTLNRYEHFKRCLESLERCTWADKTDVYIGLDYPPSEKYVEGWKKIDAYLAEKEKSNGFQNLYVRRRDHNCGMGNPKSNSALLSEEIREKYDRYISSEDDNEFAPNFLVYINKALTKFEDDERIYCVCGYNRRITLPETFTGNYYLANDFVAWGVGYWTRKQRPQKYRSFEYLKEILRDKEKYAILRKYSPESIRDIVSMLKLHKYHGDVLVNVYETLEGKYSVMPTLSKVRNHGNDGTGLHSKSMVEDFDRYFSEQIIDEAADFDFNGTPQIQPEDMRTEQFGQLIPAWKKAVKNLIFRIDLFLLRKFNYVPKSKYI